MRQFIQMPEYPVLVFVLLASLAGCGGYDSSPEQFQQGVSDQYEQLIEKVKEDPELSADEKEYEIAKLEEQRADFAAYAGGEQSQ